MTLHSKPSKINSFHSSNYTRQYEGSVTAECGVRAGLMESIVSLSVSQLLLFGFGLIDLRVSVLEKLKKKAQTLKITLQPPLSITTCNKQNWRTESETLFCSNKERSDC